MLIEALKTVYARVAYTVLSLCFAVLFTSLVLLWPNFTLLHSLSSNEGVFFGDILNMAGKILVGAPESIGSLIVVLVVLNAMLLSIVLAMAIYVVRHKRPLVKARQLFTTSGGGTLAALFGAGCVACGPLLFGGFFAAIGAGGLLLLLPLHGAEFGLLAAGLLGYAVYSLAKVITAPLVCSASR